MARRTAVVSTSNGSSSPDSDRSAFAGALGRTAFFAGAAPFDAAGDADFPPPADGPAAFAPELPLEDLAIGAGFGFPDIEAPQNGHSVASSSRTDA